MPSNHLILCYPLLLLPSIFLIIRVFYIELTLHIKWLKYWSFRFNNSSSNQYSGLISCRTDWLDLLAVQEILKNLLQYHNSKATVFWCSTFFMDQLSYPCMTTGKIIALTVWTFVSKVLSLFLNTVSRFVIAFLPRNKVSFNFMTAVIVHSNFGVQENKVCHCFYFFPFYLPRHDGIGFHDLRFLMLSFEPAFSLFCLISFNNVI